MYELFFRASAWFLIISHTFAVVDGPHLLRLSWNNLTGSQPEMSRNSTENGLEVNRKWTES